jgi:DNA-binding PadR family transcriptional regulator
VGWALAIEQGEVDGAEPGDGDGRCDLEGRGETPPSGGLTRLADRLERDGLIARTRSSEDLRGYEARITSSGRKALRRANRQHLEDVRELFLAHLTSQELETLARVWRRLKGASDDPSVGTSAATRRGTHR